VLERSRPQQHQKAQVRTLPPFVNTLLGEESSQLGGAGDELGANTYRENMEQLCIESRRRPAHSLSENRILQPIIAQLVAGVNACV
jgi:hypothetical protein